MHTTFVVDTGYLDEFFKVPGFSSQSSSQEVRARFEQQETAGSSFFIPLGCLYELGNHIVRVDEGGRRSQLAQSIRELIELCTTTTESWNITPALTRDELPDVWDSFQTEFVQSRIGLIDTHVIHEARRLKKKYRKFCKVHIWTTEKAMKSYEPDKEDSPFLR